VSCQESSSDRHERVASYFNLLEPNGMYIFYEFDGCKR